MVWLRIRIYEDYCMSGVQDTWDYYIDVRSNNKKNCISGNRYSVLYLPTVTLRSSSCLFDLALLDNLTCAL